ncbi:MAG: hypothetical protein AB1489_12430 [Acidobacteriota bacterium]
MKSLRYLISQRNSNQVRLWAVLALLFLLGLAIAPAIAQQAGKGNNRQVDPLKGRPRPVATENKPVAAADVPADLKIVLFPGTKTKQMGEETTLDRSTFTITRTSISWKADDKEQTYPLKPEESATIFTLVANGAVITKEEDASRYRCCGAPPYPSIYFNNAYHRVEGEGRLQLAVSELARQKGYSSRREMGTSKPIIKMADIDRSIIEKAFASPIILKPCDPAASKKSIKSPDGSFSVITVKGTSRVGSVQFDQSAKTITITTSCNNETQIAWIPELSAISVREYIDRNAPPNSVKQAFPFSALTTTYDLKKLTMLQQLRDK